MNDTNIVETAHNLNLHPRPSAISDSYYLAGCPNGHVMLLLLGVNTFQCEACGRTGGVEELNTWTAQEE